MILSENDAKAGEDAEKSSDNAGVEKVSASKRHKHKKKKQPRLKKKHKQPELQAKKQ